MRVTSLWIYCRAGNYNEKIVSEADYLRPSHLWIPEAGITQLTSLTCVLCSMTGTFLVSLILIEPNIIIKYRIQQFHTIGETIFNQKPQKSMLIIILNQKVISIFTKNCYSKSSTVFFFSANKFVVPLVFLYPLL